MNAGRQDHTSAIDRGTGRRPGVRVAARPARPALWMALAVSLLPGLSDPAHAAEGDGTLRVTLTGALRYEQVRKSRDFIPGLQDLTLDLVRRDGRWEPAVWAWTRALPGQEHLGRLTGIEAGAEALKLRVSLNVNPSAHRPCVLGGPVELTIDLRKQDAGWAGAFTGRSTDTNQPELRRALEDAWGMGYKPGARAWEHDILDNRLDAYLAGGDSAGAARAAFTGALAAPASFKGLAAPGEHPRLLFRKADLPRLRARADTPEGRKILAEIKDLLERADQHGYAYFPPAAEHSMGPVWAAGWGLMYQLTGDKSYARKAGQQFWGNMYGSYYNGGGWLHAYTLMGMALAYDLCQEAWDEDLRGLVYGYLERNIRDLAHRHDGRDLLGTTDRYKFANDQGDFAFPAADHGHAVKFRAAAAIAALALVNDPPPAYHPTPWESIQTLPPARDYQPWIGVPVVAFESDKMFRDWLVNGPFQRGTVESVMEPLGGLAGLRPEPGTSVTVDGVRLDFRRYLPAGRDNPNGPTIYQRDCNRYWGSGTGGGYWPGIELLGRWRQKLGKAPAVNVVLYTVLKNERPRLVQALPNWRSQSAGNRMWIAGRPVRDGDLLRLEPGLYPVTVEVCLLGGYTAMAPKLREYTRADHERDSARHAQALAAYSGSGVLENEMERNLEILRRSLSRYIPLAVGAQGWGGFDTHETLLPFLQMYRHLTGIELSRGSGLEELVPLALRLRGHGRDRACDYMVSQSCLLMPARYQPPARWYLDRHGLGIARPIDAVIALATHPFDVKPQPPETLLKLGQTFDSHGIAAFHSGWSGSQDFLALLQAGGTLGSLYGGGHLVLHGAGSMWAHPRGDGSYKDYSALNNISVAKLYPVGPGQLVHAEFQPDGSGTATVLMNQFRDLKTLELNRFELYAEDPGISIQRSLAADFSGKSGAPALFVTADKITAAGRREKVWRMALGHVTPREANERPGRRESLHLGRGTFLAAPGRTSYTLAGTVIAPAQVDLRTRNLSKGSLHTALEIKADRVIDELERLQDGALDELGGKLKRDNLDSAGGPDAPAGPQTRPRPARPPSPGSLEGDLGDDAIDTLMRGINRQMSKEQRERDRKLPPTVMIVVMTIQDGAAPKVAWTGEGDKTVITVGKQTIRYDGSKLILGAGPP